MYEPTFEFYDKTLLDDVNRGVAHVHEFFRLLALCHTVMPEYKDGNACFDQLIHLVIYIRSYAKKNFQNWDENFI